MARERGASGVKWCVQREQVGEQRGQLGQKDANNNLAGITDRR